MSVRVNFTLLNEQWYVETPDETILLMKSALLKYIACIVLEMLPFGGDNAVILDELARYSFILLYFVEKLLCRLDVVKIASVDHL